MKLKVLQQIHVSAIRSDTMRPGEVIEVDDARGADLLRSLFDTFERVDEPQPEQVSATEPAPPEAPAKGKGKGRAKV